MEQESVKAYERFLTFGVFPESGAPWEGMGKNALAAENLLAIARRGPALVAAKASYNHMAKFILHTTLPSGNLQVEDDLWGGSYNREVCRRSLNFNRVTRCFIGRCCRYEVCVSQ